jgi:dTDP-4-dehydrorhamnose reductase
VNILVTGANGLLGSRLCAQLASRGHAVLGAGRGPLRVAAERWRYAEIDLTRAEAAISLLDHSRPDVIVNCAAMTDVDGCERDPWQAFVANAEVPARLARESASRGAHLVHVSTDYVFDGEGGPYAEDALPNPRGVYAITKHMGEQAVRALAKSWTIARTAVVYGWPPAGRNNFGAWLVSTLAKGQRVNLFSDQYVSPSLALNVAQLVAELAERRLPGLWNVAGASVVNRVEFGRALCERFGFDPKLVTPTRLVDAPLASPRPPRCGLRVDKAQRELQAQPLPLESAIDQFFAEWKAA